MNKIELMEVLRKIVKEELRRALVSKEIGPLIKEVIKKEVRTEVDRLLTEMEQKQPGEVIQERTTSPRVNSMIARGELPVKVKPVHLAKNQKLNDLLNQTAQSIARGEATLPSQEGPEGQLALLREQYANMGSDSTGKTAAAMIPNVDVEGRPMIVNPAALPTHVQNALTKDYRKFMKKVDEKRG